MSTFVDGFLAVSVLILAFELIFSLTGIPFDCRFLPLRTFWLSRVDDASGRPLQLLLLHPVQDGLFFDLVHLGSLLPGALRTGDNGNREPVPDKREIPIIRPQMINTALEI